MAERATFPVKLLQVGVPNTGGISPVCEGAATKFVSVNLYLCTNKEQSKGLFCLVQAKGGAMFGNPTLFGTPLLYHKCLVPADIAWYHHILRYDSCNISSNAQLRMLNT